MPRNDIRVALDLSCAFDAELGGVGITAIRQISALIAQQDALDLRLFATRPRTPAKAFATQRHAFTRWTVLPYTRLLKHHLWTGLGWPPIEWFCGEVDIAHGLFHQLPAARHARRVATIHDLSFLRMPEVHTPQTIKIHSALVQQCARQADACIAVSQYGKNDLIELLGMPPERIAVVHDGVDLTQFEGELDRDALAEVRKKYGVRPAYFIHLSTVEPRKNLIRVFEAYQRLRTRCPDCPQLVLAGKRGWLSEPIFERLAPLVESGDAVHCGYLRRRDAMLLLRGAVACVYPSLYEGFGLPALEAMAARTPLIASSAGALPEVVGDGGALPDPTDVDAIEAALVEVVDGKDAVRARVEAGYERAKTFTWEHSAHSLAGFYRALVQSQT